MLLLPGGLIMIYFNYENDVPYMNHQFGSVKTIEETTTFAEMYGSFTSSGFRSFYANSANAQFIGTACGLIMFLILKHLSWHSGASVLTSTIYYAFGDIMDTAVVVLVLLTGFGAFGSGIFGVSGGSYNFLSFISGFNTMARLSFGLLEYDEYMSDGHGQGYEGIGLGGANYLRYVILWISFILLSTIIVNILIAVISDGFEIHKDKQRLRTKSGQTFFAYMLHRLVYFTCFQFFPCCKEPSWVGKMRFTSSNYAKTLLKYTDALPDGMVFDQKLQNKVMEMIIGQEDDRIDKMNSTGKLRVVRTQSSSIKKVSNSGIINSDDVVAYETPYQFFSTINSEKALRSVIDTIFEIANDATKKQKAIESFQSNDAVYYKIWSLYKRTKEKQKQKQESRVTGNHVRKVVKPIEERLERMDKRFKEEMYEIKDDIKELKALLLKIANNKQ